MYLNPTIGGNSEERHNWNYSNPNNPGYSTELVGTVINIQEVQAREYSSNGQKGNPKFWVDGNPVMNIRMIFAGPSGGYRTWTFAPASKAAKEGKKKSVHLDLFALTGNTDMMNLVGKTLRVSTQEPPAGFGYGVNNPRPWHVELVPDVVYELKEQIDPIYLTPRVLCDEAAHGGAYNAPQQQPQQYQAPQQYQQQPQQQYQPQYQQAPQQYQQMPQQAYAQPQYQQAPQPQPQQQPQSYQQMVDESIPF